jgi:hypothetical protein
VWRAGDYACTHVCFGLFWGHGVRMRDRGFPFCFQSFVLLEQMRSRGPMALAGLAYTLLLYVC